MIIFLYGRDSFRSRQKLQELKEKFIREVDKSRLNLEILDGEEIDFTRFSQAVGSAPFLAGKRMIIFEHLLTNKQIQENILEFLKNKGRQQENILIFWEEVASANSKLFKFLAKEKYAQEFKFLNDLELGRWIKREVNKRKGKIDIPATRALVEYVGNNLWLLNNEINKLIAFKKGAEIIRADVEELTRAKFDDNIFGLVDALGTKNKKLAIRLLANQLAFGSSPLYIIAMLVRQYRILLQVQEYLDQPSTELARKLKLHPFVVKKTLAQARRYSFSELKNIYGELLEMDRKIKTSSWKPELLIDLLIAKV